MTEPSKRTSKKTITSSRESFNYETDTIKNNTIQEARTWGEKGKIKTRTPTRATIGAIRRKRNVDTPTCITGGTKRAQLSGLDGGPIWN